MRHQSHQITDKKVNVGDLEISCALPVELSAMAIVSFQK